MNVPHRFVIIAAIFITGLITASIIAVKPIILGGLPAAIVIFPLSCLGKMGDVASLRSVRF